MGGKIRLLFVGILLVISVLVVGACGPAQPAQYILSTSVSPSGTGVVRPSSGTYDVGTTVTLYATPASGYRFDHWSGDATGTSSPITVTMDTHKNITAYFKAQYTLSTSVIPPWGGSINPSGGKYDPGTKVTLAATPASDYRFDHWSGDVTATSSPVTFTMDTHKNITAYFVSLAAEIYFDNGYAEPLVISVDGEEKTTVMSFSYPTIVVEKGQHEILIKRQSGELLESQVVDCKEEARYIYNIGRLYTYVVETVYYGAPPADPKPQVEIANKTFFEIPEEVDYIINIPRAIPGIVPTTKIAIWHYIK